MGSQELRAEGDKQALGKAGMLTFGTSGVDNCICPLLHRSTSGNVTDIPICPIEKVLLRKGDNGRSTNGQFASSPPEDAPEISPSPLKKSQDSIKARTRSHRRTTHM